MAKIGIIMGSNSDWHIMEHAAKMLQQFGVDYEAQVVSAHRTPDLMFDYAKTARERGLQAIIAGAGGAAHLPGMVAAQTTLRARRARAQQISARRRFAAVHCANAQRRARCHLCHRRSRRSQRRPICHRVACQPRQRLSAKAGRFPRPANAKRAGDDLAACWYRLTRRLTRAQRKRQPETKFSVAKTPITSSPIS